MPAAHAPTITTSTSAAAGAAIAGAATNAADAARNERRFSRDMVSEIFPDRAAAMPERKHYRDFYG
jgi:hypothetical protein